MGSYTLIAFVALQVILLVVDHLIDLPFWITWIPAFVFAIVLLIIIIILCAVGMANLKEW